MKRLSLRQKINLLKLVYNGLINYALQKFSLYFCGNAFCKPEAIDILPTFRCNLRYKHCKFYEF